MPLYHSLGHLPRKRHTAFRQPSGALYHEHLMGSLGFSGPSSLLYHVHAPTRVLRTSVLRTTQLMSESEHALRMRHFRLADLPATGSLTVDRTPLLFNSDVALSLVRSGEGDDFFYKNVQADEIVYVSEGEGELETQLGELPYRQGDYLVIPRGVVHRYRPARRGASVGDRKCGIGAHPVALSQ